MDCKGTPYAECTGGTWRDVATDYAAKAFAGGVVAGTTYVVGNTFCGKTITGGEFFEETMKGVTGGFFGEMVSRQLPRK